MMKITDKIRIRGNKISFKRIGMPLVYIGAISLIVCILTGCNKNIFLILPALIIIIGVVFHVSALKRESKY